MKIGLLECDHVLPELRSIAGDYQDMFLEFLPGYDWAFFDVCNGQFPAPDDDCDAYLCTGSRFSVYDEVDWILELKAFVRQVSTSDKKFIGVCFGHQMMGEALGGKVKKAESGWNVGVHTFEILRPAPWMSPFQSSLNLMMMCQDQVVQLPPGSTVLARTAYCPVGMFQAGANMLGIQGHPEFPTAYEARLLELRRERIGSDKVDAALKSLDLPVDATPIAAWIGHFLKA